LSKEKKKPLSLTAVLLNIPKVLAKESHRYDTRNVAFRSIDVHVQFQLLPNSLDVLQTLLIVRPSTTDPDLDLVLQEYRSELTESADDTFESGCNILQHIFSTTRRNVKWKEGSLL
jgi:hypothetical protein